jgi:hypothetical protein
MKVKAAMVTELKQKLEPYGIEIEDNEAQNAFAQVIQSAAPTQGTESIVNTKAREIWEAKRSAAESNGQPDPAPEG